MSLKYIIILGIFNKKCFMINSKKKKLLLIQYLIMQYEYNKCIKLHRKKVV